VSASEIFHRGFTIGPLALEHSTQRETLMSWPGITMFLLFFGIATMDALTSRNWLRIVFWIAMAIAFAALDYMGQRRRMSSR